MTEEKDNTSGLGQSSVPADAGIPDEPQPDADKPVKVVRVGGADDDTPAAAPAAGNEDAVAAAQKAAEAAATAAKVAADAAKAAGLKDAGQAAGEPSAEEGTPPQGETEEAADSEEADEAAEETKKDKKQKKKRKKKKKKKEKKPKEPRPKIHLRDIPHLLFPEHIGDIFVVAMIFALAIGAGLFWFLAWIPTNEAAMTNPQDNIQQFSDEELEEIITILENREEASKAPVVPPARDPFN